MVALEYLLASGADVALVIQLAALLLTVALILTQKKPKLANLDDALQSTATRGAYIPLLVGRHRVGPIFAFVDDSETHQTDSPGSQPGFGKGGGGSPTPPSYWEDSLHIICVGPASRLLAIYENGETIFSADVSPDSNPSGSTFTLADGSVFRIYWGFPDDPTLPRLASSTRHGLNVKYALTMKIFWLSKNLGQSRQWPRLEYEVECPCYSQIAQSSSEVPLEADDALPTYYSSGLSTNPNSTSRVDVHLLQLLTSPGGTLLLVLAGHETVANQLPLGFGNLSVLRKVFSQGNLIKVATPPSTPTTFGTNITISPSLGTVITTPSQVGISSSWKYYIIRRLRTASDLGASISTPPLLVFANTHFFVLDVVEAIGVPIQNLTPAVPSFVQLILPTTTVRPGHASPVETLGFDGVNPVHLMDQFLFAKFPYGAGRDRTRFDARSIEKAALTLQGERIRGSMAVKDGEGVESVIASVMQDCGIFISWDPQTGLFVFFCLRYEDPTTAADLPPEMILKSPEVISIQGSRPVDVIAFTYRDRERNYREEPLVVLDDGQISLSETQKSRKVPIEVTTDGPSAGRLIPRRQQEVLSNLQVFTFETNHATQMIVPGVRISAHETEGVGFVFRVVSIKRDVNSGKVILKTLIDCYDPPPSVPEEQSSDDLPVPSPLPRKISAAADAIAGPAVEVPRSLSEGKIQVLFPAARLSDRTQGVAVWASRDGSSYTVQGTCPTAICGILDEPLGAGLCYDTVSSINTVPVSADFDAIEDLSAFPDSWRAGRQLLVIGSEICFLQAASGDSLVGLIRGRLGTVVQEHPAGTPFCVVLAHTVRTVESAMFLPGKTISYKLQALEASKVSTVDDSPTQDITIQGLAYKPLAPTALRLSNLRPDYSTSDDITIKWCWHSTEFPRTGLGMQALGAASGTSNPRGHFTFKIKDGATVLLEGILGDPLMPLDAADRSTIGLDVLPSWTFEVVAVEGSFSSAPVSLTLYPV